ncbi:hypothetical protein KRR39_06965 [Nocardioides panacis]|uniref:ABM domain-containing protein n=1 Tax=Nocardioides panacis TaxID=2849501 RepID=A0A975T0T0_9ACTN|nr:hypothetical protein [Nocardioides panacis]QWZ09494.1 hypothetical protein KRR39_06965 [Nocardioides panacis]
MYGYTMHVPAPAETYLALHQAVADVIGEKGGGEGLILHLALRTDQGFDLTEVWESKEQLDAFNQDVFPPGDGPGRDPHGRAAAGDRGARPPRGGDATGVQLRRDGLSVPRHQPHRGREPLG